MVESIHLLGLVLAHTQNTRNARATIALFDQLIRHLHLLREMPGQNGELLISRSDRPRGNPEVAPGYTVVLGTLTITEASISMSPLLSNSPITSHLGKALNQAFRCLADQGIHSICLQLPDRSAGRIDQLRLALNIAARYRTAADSLSSITFRYFDRVINVPLILDENRPDPNLTITAGLNGLSANNMRSLIRQADALYKLTHGEPRHTENTYERLFSLRNLRTQLMKPSLEINKRRRPENHLEKTPDFIGGIPQAIENGTDQKPADYIPWPENSELLRKGAQPILDVVLSDDYGGIDPPEMGRRLLYASKLLSDFGKGADSNTTLHFLHLLQERYEHAPELFVKGIQILRRGLKLAGNRKALVIGLIHPDLLELILLVRIRLSAEAHFAAAKGLQQAVESRSIESLQDLAKQNSINFNAMHAAFNLLGSCIESPGKFNDVLYQQVIKQRKGISGAEFEIIWYWFKQAVIEHSPAVFLQAIKQSAVHLTDKKAGMRLLLADLLKSPFDVAESDRYALLIANMLLRTRNREQHSNIDITPFEVLRIGRGLLLEIQQYAAERLEFDQVAVLTKMQAIHDRMRVCLKNRLTKTTSAELQALLKLEREALLFSALTGGNTARMVLCNVFSQYEALFDEISQSHAGQQSIEALLENLHISVKGLQRIGQYEDLHFLKQLDHTVTRLKRLDAGIAYNQSIYRLVARVESAVKAIRMHSV